MLNTTELNKKIATLQAAIASPVTPAPQKEVFKTSLAKVQAQWDNERVLIETCQELISAANSQLEPAFSLSEMGGYAKATLTNISDDGKTIDIYIEGQSPIVDKEDVKKIKMQVIDLEDKAKFEARANGTSYTGKFQNGKVTSATAEIITATIQILLENGIER